MEEILGNEEIKEHFRTAVRQKKISHAYLLEGEKGSGKKLIARAFARLLQCESPIYGPSGLVACGKCQSCVMMDHKDHPDVIEVNHEKPGLITVDEIRDQLVNTVDVTPYKGPWKIYIIDEAEKMKAPAQNAMLKTIEEPPEYAVILLLASNCGALLPTILSRCIHLNTKPLAEEKIRSWLIEKYSIEPKTAEFCAGFAMGNMGKAIEAASSETFGQLRDYGLDVLRRIHELEPYEIIGAVKDLIQWKDQIDEYLDIMLIWFRDMLVLKATKNDSRLIFNNEYLILKRQGDLISYEDIHAIINEIGRTRKMLKFYVNNQAALEVLHLGIRSRCR